MNDDLVEICMAVCIFMFVLGVELMVIAWAFS